MIHPPPPDPPPNQPEGPCFVTLEEAMERIAVLEKFMAEQEQGEEAQRHRLEQIRYYLRHRSHLREAIEDWHEEKGYECCAHSEGQACCIDELLGSTEPST